MIFCPPRHGKSEQATVRYPVWRLEQNPATRVVLAAYNQRFAEKLSRKARRIAKERLPISRDRNTAAQWETDEGGGLRACGVGSPPTGEGCDLLVIDDPIKRREEADSEVYRERVWEWYSEDLYTRLEPGAAVILILTRWHHHDLAGQILESEDGPSWEVVRLPALAEENDPLGRRPGQALCPERYNEADLARIRRVQGLAFDALYQQRPTPRSGGMFQRHWFSQVMPGAPAGLTLIRYWDKAGTAGGGAYTAGVLMGKDPEGRYYVLDVRRGQLGPSDREKLIQATAHEDRARYGRVSIGIEEEPADAGRESAQATIRGLAGFTAFAHRVTGSKEARAEPFAAQCGAGNVWLVAGPWNAAYIEELCQFPKGAYKDQVDGSSGAFLRLSTTVDRFEIGTSKKSANPFHKAPPGVFLS